MNLDLHLWGTPQQATGPQTTAVDRLPVDLDLELNLNLNLDLDLESESI